MSLDALLSNDGARQAVMAALEVPPPLGKLLINYIGLFRPAKNEMSFDRVASLLNELLPQIKEGNIESGGQTWAAPQGYWREAIEQMLAQRHALTLPLKNHKYLFKVIAGISEKSAAKKETKREEERRSGGGESRKDEKQISPEVRAEIAGRFRAATKKAGIAMPGKEDQLAAIQAAMKNQQKENV